MIHFNDTHVKIGDNVIFDLNKVELFKEETDSNNSDLKKYQKLVLGGIGQIGTVKAIEGNLSTVSYPDGWELPVPTKYLIVIP